jgi:hypothetical protein
MTPVEAEVLDEFDLDIQIDQADGTDLPHRKNAPRAQSRTLACSCTLCCPTIECAVTAHVICSSGCN